MGRKSILDSVNPEYLQRLLNESNNYVQVMKAIGYSAKSGNARKAIFKYIKQNGLKTDQIEENIKIWKSKMIKEISKSNEYSLEEIFNGEKPYINSYRLRRRLIKEGYKTWKCECCGFTEWDNEPIPLQLHHENGDGTDNRLENLKLLCPNCHALTQNYCGKNTKRHKDGNSNASRAQKQREYRAKQKAKDLDYHNRTYEERTKSPGRDVLKEEIKIANFTAVGRKYGVTDNSVRKWCIHYGLPSKTKDIRNMTDEEWSKL